MPPTLPGPQSNDSAALPESGKCRAIPADGEPPCPRPAKDRPPRPGRVVDPHQGERGEILELCREHDTERLKLYFRYKAASKEGEELGAAARDARFRTPERLGREEVGAAIAHCEAYGKALDEEIEGRESHGRRFVLRVDDGHARWLRDLRDRRDENKSVLDGLIQRRDDLARANWARAEEDRRRREFEEAARRREEEVDRVRRRALAMRRLEDAERERAAREEEVQRKVDAALAAIMQQEEVERQRRDQAEREAAQEHEAAVIQQEVAREEVERNNIRSMGRRLRVQEANTEARGDVYEMIQTRKRPVPPPPISIEQRPPIPPPYYQRHSAVVGNHTYSSHPALQPIVPPRYTARQHSTLDRDEEGASGFCCSWAQLRAVCLSSLVDES